ncbi:MAG TPA: hypothetical protein VEY89_09030, partial [Candidatus Dormibacteraeota bacterium]|nr:hypothetical protein [Candidatus Dormibacteraeota bacterium]
AAALSAVLIVACNMQKGQAEQAVASAEQGLNATRDEAQKYVPEQLGGVEAQLGQMKDSYQRGDYAGTLAAQPAMMKAINGLKDAAAQKKTAADAAAAKAKDDWASTSTEVPKMVDELAKRVDTFSKNKHLPKGVTKDNVSAAKTGLDQVKSTWSDATAAASSGDYTTAMSKADTVKSKTAEMMKSLGMKPPG